MPPPALLPRLAPEHDLRRFHCGAAEIDEWLARQAMKGQTVGNAAVFVVTVRDEVVGFYALASAAVERAEAPSKVARNAPNPIPVLLLARLGVDARAKHRGIARLLLRDALWRAAQVSHDVGFRALLIHCRDETARDFYEHVLPALARSPNDPLHLLVPTAAIRQVAGRADEQV